MLKISYAGLKELKSELNTIGKHKFKKITAMALTATAKKYREHTIEEMRTVFDRPTPWTLKSVFYTPANINQLTSKVWFKDRSAMTGKGTPAAEYLTPQIYGGTRDHKRYEKALIRYGAMQSGQFTVPGAAVKLDPYGNIPSDTIVRLLTAARALEGMAGTKFYGKVGGYKLRKGTKRFFVGKPGKAPIGIWEQYDKRRVRPMMIFTEKRPTYRKRLLFFEKAQEFCPSTFRIEFTKLAKETIQFARSRK